MLKGPCARVSVHRELGRLKGENIALHRHAICIIIIAVWGAKQAACPPHSIATTIMMVVVVNEDA